jgi:4-hydroxy-tetrahydrodipicolinate synthase
MPTHTKLFFEPETVRKAAEIPSVAGLKDSSANMIYFHRLQSLFKDRPEFSLLIGPEELLGETVLLGGHGGVSGGANVAPRLYVDLYNAAVAKNLERTTALHRRVMQISNTIYSVGQYGSSIIKGIKCSLSCMGICDDFMAEPFHRFRQPQRELIERHLRDLGLLTG